MPTVEEVLAAASKKYDLRVGSLSEIAEPVQSFSTGNLAIDHIIGCGGLPLGRSVELYGLPASGKSTTALQSAATLQQLIIAGGNEDLTKGPLVAADDRIIYFDYEHALDPEYALALGLNLDHPSFLFSQPDSLEQGANVARALLETGKVRLMIWDSVAAMTPSALLEAETGKATVALQARLMSTFLKTLTPALKEHRCTAVFLNHLMDMVDTGGSRPGMPARTSTPGGRALKYYASLRLEFTQIKTLKTAVHDELSNEQIDQVTATNVKIKVIKNKVAPPFREAVVRVRFGRGFDNFYSAVQVLLAHKVLKAATGWYYFDRAPELVHVDMPVAANGKGSYIRGEESLFDFADSHPEWRRQVIQMATEVLGKGEGNESDEGPKSELVGASAAD